LISLDFGECVGFFDWGRFLAPRMHSIPFNGTPQEKAPRDEVAGGVN
jgi:hypothetical protein